MKCANHPVSPAVGKCAGCEIALCGICANFIEDEIYCEKCERIRASERFVAQQKAQLEKPSRNDSIRQTDSAQVAREARESARKRNIQFAIIALCTMIIGIRLLFWVNGQRSAELVSTPQFSLPVTALPECLMVFQEIGQILASGGQPLPGLRCADSSVPNIVTREGGAVKVSHPNPGAYGLSELYVTSANPVPQLVD